MLSPTTIRGGVSALVKIQAKFPGTCFPPSLIHLDTGGARRCSARRKNKVTTATAATQIYRNNYGFFGVAVAGARALNFTLYVSTISLVIFVAGVAHSTGLRDAEMSSTRTYPLSWAYFLVNSTSLLPTRSTISCAACW